MKSAPRMDATRTGRHSAPSSRADHGLCRSRGLATPATDTVFLHLRHSSHVLLPKTRRGEGVQTSSPPRCRVQLDRDGEDPMQLVLPSSPRTGENKRGLSQGGKEDSEGPEVTPRELRNPWVLLFVLLLLLFLLLLPLGFRFLLLVIFDQLLHLLLFEDSDDRLPALSGQGGDLHFFS